MEMISFAYSLLLTKTLKNQGTIVEKLYITMVGYYHVVCRGGGYEIYLASLGQYLMESKSVQWDHLNTRNIVCKNKHILVMCNCMVSMATHNTILKKGCTYKNTHISAATHSKIINFVPN